MTNAGKMSAQGHTLPRFGALPRRGYLSVGAWIILGLAAGSSVLILLRPERSFRGLTMWTSAREHVVMYGPIVEQWNKQRDPPVDLFLFSGDVLSRRMMSGFLSAVPVADLLEVERSLIGPVFAGPLKDVGFVDLTDRLKADGLYDQFNAPSYSPWTSRGHVFGLPHDVHPVLLCYRSDIMEAAGIDMSQIQTWDDFARVTRPLLKDVGADGKPKHYPINMWYTSIDQIESLILEADGRLFNEQGNAEINSDINAHVLGTIISWTVGPNRIGADAPEFTASGNQLRVDGYVVCSITPDWLGGVWKNDVPQLSGKLRLMPLPAWMPGGRRTSVWGGTMLGICKSSPNFEQAWTFAKHIYLNPELARRLYETNDIISPIKSMWKLPFYQIPDPYFGGQLIGQAYIDQAPNVPMRTSSPYNMLAKLRLQDAAVSLHDYAVSTNTFDADKLEPQAHVVLQLAEAAVQQAIDKNVFLREAN